MIAQSEGIEFRIDVVGETSGEQFKGKFRLLPRLSYRLRLERDRRRRELLGNAPGEPDQESVIYASLLAELHVRLVEWPKWWVEADKGLDLEDEAPLAAIATKMREILDAENAKTAEAGKAAEEAIRAKVRENAPTDDE